MRVAYTGRNIEVTSALRDFTEAHLKKIRKILGEAIHVHMTLTVQKHRQIAEIHLHTRSLDINGLEETNDMYASINAVLEKAERQALKHKGKKITRKRHPGQTASRPPSNSPSSTNRPPSGTPRVIKSTSFAPKPMTVEEAVQEVSGANGNFLVFRNAESEKVSVLYKRKDGNFGLIEP